MTKFIVRDANNANWIDVFCKGGWKMKLPDGSYITMTAQNTRLRNPENNAWIAPVCPIPAPTTINGGKIFSHRLVDSAGYLWCAGYPVGVYEDLTTTSTKWKKVFYSTTNKTHIKGVDKIWAEGAYSLPAYTPTYLFMTDGRVLYSGDNRFGFRGDGTGTNTGTDLSTNATIKDVTAAWRLKFSINSIVQFDSQVLVTDTGIPYILGLTRYMYTAGRDQGNNLSNSDVQGYSAAAYTKSWSANYNTYYFAATWSIPKYNGAGVSGIRSAKKIRNCENVLCVITSDYKIMQSRLWMLEDWRIETNGPMPSPTIDPHTLVEISLPNSEQAYMLHTGGLLQALSGQFYIPNLVSGSSSYPDFPNTRYKRINWTATGVSTMDEKFLSGIKRIKSSCYSRDILTVFILTYNGNLYAWGDGSSGWFGSGSVADLATPTLILTDVADFDADGGSAYALKNDNTIWATGQNVGGRLGIGHTSNVTTWTQGIIEHVST